MMTPVHFIFGVESNKKRPENASFSKKEVDVCMQI